MSSVGKSSSPMLMSGWTAVYNLQGSGFNVFFGFLCTCLLTVLASVSADYCGRYSNCRVVEPTHTLLHTGNLKFKPLSIKPSPLFVESVEWVRCFDLNSDRSCVSVCRRLWPLNPNFLFVNHRALIQPIPLVHRL